MPENLGKADNISTRQKLSDGVQDQQETVPTGQGLVHKQQARPKDFQRTL